MDSPISLTMGPDERRRPKLEAEVERLSLELAAYDKERRFMPKLAWSALLAIPAFFLSPLIGFAVLAAAIALVITGLYLVEVRRRECAGNIRTTKAELDRLDALKKRAAKVTA
ncbi:MAG: hypothetical protein AAGF12_28285 [Myxococcota bacterium]